MRSEPTNAIAMIQRRTRNGAKTGSVTAAGIEARVVRCPEREEGEAREIAVSGLLGRVAHAVVNPRLVAAGRSR